MNQSPAAPAFTPRVIRANGIDINVATAGSGPSILLIHGWPHTWRIWQPLMERLSADHHVIAPDLRGTGGTSRTVDGYDVAMLACDAVSLLDALRVDEVTVVGIDLGVQVAAMLALATPERVQGLIVMQGLLGRLPGAETFLAKGPPWWFGLHAVPDLAETVIEGNEAAYIDWFLTNGTADRRGIDGATRDAFVAAYTSRDALRGGFEHYRAFSTDAEQIETALARGPFAMPTLAIEGGVVGEAITRQLEPVSSRFVYRKIDRCGHLIPLEQPDILAEMIRSFAGLAVAAD
jgi:pimeloyl-ACP methyl ester carboxylesterase